MNFHCLVDVFTGLGCTNSIGWDIISMGKFRHFSVVCSAHIECLSETMLMVSILVVTCSVVSKHFEMKLS